MTREREHLRTVADSGQLTACPRMVQKVAGRRPPAVSGFRYDACDKNFMKPRSCESGETQVHRAALFLGRSTAAAIRYP